MKALALIASVVVASAALCEPVTFAGRTLFNINAASGGKTAHERVLQVEARLIAVLGETRIMDGDVRVVPLGADRAIYVKKHLFVTCTRDDAALTKGSVDLLAKTWRGIIAKNVMVMHLRPQQVGPKSPSGEKR